MAPSRRRRHRRAIVPEAAGDARENPARHGRRRRRRCTHPLPVTEPADLFADRPPVEAPPLPPPRPVPPAPVVLADAWPDARPFPLDGTLERAGFSPVWTSAVVFVVAFIAFQVIGGLIVAIGPITEALRTGAVPTDAADLIGDSPRLFLGGNAIGQALAFGLLALVAARMSTSVWPAFLRLRRPGAPGLALAAVGWMAIYPVVLFLGELNARLPLPPSLQELDALRGEMLEGLLLGDGASTLFLFLTVAMAPALFEEVLFRGYLMRQAERRWGARVAIVAVGVFFGAYHLSITQLVPLSVLGVYLGFVVWATGSLWTGVLVHLLNNGLAVAVTGYARTHPDLDVETMEGMGVPVYLSVALAAVGVLAVWTVGRALVARREALTGGRPDAQPVAPFSAPPLHTALP